MYSLDGSARPHPPAPDKEIAFTVLVRSQTGAPGLPDLTQWQAIPIAERQFLSSAEFERTYGSSEHDVLSVASFFEDRGMTIRSRHTGAGTVEVQAKTSQIHSVFNVQLYYYRGQLRPAARKRRDDNQPPEETYIGFEGSISVPSALHDKVIHIFGLDTRTFGASGGCSGDPPSAQRLMVAELAALYGFPAGVDASQQTIGIFSGEGNDEKGKSLSNYSPADVATYFNNQTIGYNCAPTVVPVSLTVGGQTYSNDPDNPTQELSQDIMTAATIAQGCTVNVYFSDLTEQGWLAFLTRVLFPQGKEKRPTIVSISWTMYDEQTYRDSLSFLFQRLAVVGTTVFAISGDWGANNNIIDGQPHVGWPGSDPWVTCVGGTVVGNVRSSGSFTEHAWSDRDNPDSQFTIDGHLGVTGGGMSRVFATPPYQLTVDRGRFIPDIAGMVGFRGFIVDGKRNYFIGTSCSTPLYAGLFAALASALGGGGEGGVLFGPLNTVLYQINRGVYRDVTFGHNDSGDMPACAYFVAEEGYDAVSGLGSVNGRKMLEELRRVYRSKTRGFGCFRN
ncbi:S53 family peptidase [Aspergillus novofumigatus IBT 16806]|uniref:tripeptidyl-peptidase II n=1 Tax=Aspergillus novofumigatus (strain IBT 16806) TaxID=1392255 RepID=A0A2I1CC21_ASPN1|nr:putative serine protease [Aspergillus novofumigatus IBT 16806]PKX95136.1 putative serine protease [Aspergillus novofumigatus IBT 16806]